jgi:hypothetical protein
MSLQSLLLQFGSGISFLPLQVLHTVANLSVTGKPYLTLTASVSLDAIIALFAHELYAVK